MAELLEISKEETKKPYKLKNYITEQAVDLRNQLIHEFHEGSNK